MPLEQQQITANTESNVTSYVKFLKGGFLAKTLASAAVLQGLVCSLGYWAWCNVNEVSPVEGGTTYAFSAGAAIGWLSLPLMAIMHAYAKELYKKAKSDTGRCPPFIFLLLALLLDLLAIPVNGLLTGGVGMAMINQLELIDTVGFPAGSFGGVIAACIVACCCPNNVKSYTNFFISPHHSTEDQPLIVNGATAPHVNGNAEAPVGYQAIAYQKQ